MYWNVYESKTPPETIFKVRHYRLGRVHGKGLLWICKTDVMVENVVLLYNSISLTLKN